jgi:uncharacterized membrane protein YhaH (DUF805 family)
MIRRSFAGLVRETLMNLLYFLFGFDGRFNRAKYWLAVALYTAVSLGFAFFAIDTLRLLDKDSSFEFLGGGLVLWITGLSLALMVLWSSLATGVKRLHDRDKSGWWILLFLLAPIVLSGAARTAIHGGAGVLLTLASFAIGVWAIIELGFLPGTRGANLYGPDPLLPDDQTY